MGHDEKKHASETIKKWLVTYAILIVFVLLLKLSERVVAHTRDVQGPWFVGLAESWIQLCVDIEFLGVGQELRLEVHEAQILEDRIRLDVASEVVRIKLHRHFDKGHGESTPMLRLLGGRDSRSSPKLDAAARTVLHWKLVPCSISVRTNIVDDLVPSSLVNIIKCSLVCAQATVCIKLKGNRNGRANVTLAEAEDSVLS